ncbi:uncharacterized protein LOC113522157 [Galleria mellonella]|uniref:Uncharacterized protein LOC113522157 n=1 Tax=Galleria mellonella TaxID=7137 RepID=A0A6J1X2D8_GALME|nr:uncharacterized protein LOC113522157 [Galleria mellonella]
MKFIYLFCAFLVFVSGISGKYIRETRELKKIEENSVFLRKLLYTVETNQQNDTRSWNDILADILVDSINAVLYKNDKTAERITDTSGKWYFTTWISKSLLLFKNIINNRPITNDGIAKNNEVEDFGEILNESDSDAVTDDNVDINNDVEVFEPRYHGKRCAGCKETSDGNNDCPEGSVRDKEDNCVLKTVEPLISAVPSQCPIGYRLDRLGFCRFIFRRNA